MRILILASPWLGGSGTVGLELAKELSNKHFVVFLSFDYPYRISYERNFVFFSIVPFTYSLFPYPLYHSSLITHIVDLVQRYKIDIIHAHYSIVFGESAGYSKMMIRDILGKKVKFILTFHGTDLIGFNFEKIGETPFKSINQFLIDTADKITTASNFMKNLILQNYKVNPNKIKVIPNFVNTGIFKKERDFDEREYIIHCSNFRKVKRAEKVFKSFLMIKDKINPKTKLVFIGQGPDREKIEKEVREKNISDKVIFKELKSPEDMSYFLNKSLVAVYPSLFENFSLSILEAMSCGVPVVATKVGGIPEVLNNENGFLIKNIKKPEKEITKAILEIISNRKKWETLSKNAEKTAKNFSTDKIIKEYEDVYKEIRKNKTYVL
jgi:N-acetyl-alpha-D-glucosaminyl L-malate synthase BshA